MPSIYTCGEALIDLVPDLVGDSRCYRPAPGGCPYNSAIAAARAGAEVFFVGDISTDFFGDMLVRRLTNNGVHCDLVRRSDRPTTLAFVDLQSGEARYAFYDAGSANVNLQPPLAGSIGGDGDILLVGSISLIGMPAADRIARFAVDCAPHMALAVDPNVRANMIVDRDVWQQRIDNLFAEASIVRLSDEDLAVIRPDASASEFAAGLLDHRASLVVVTRGRNGSEVFTRNHHLEVAAPQVAVSDTVGAGDTLIGSLLAWLVTHGLSSRTALSAIDQDMLRDMMGFATCAAALNCARCGCNPPFQSEIQAFRDDAGRH